MGAHPKPAIVAALLAIAGCGDNAATPDGPDAATSDASPPAACLASDACLATELAGACERTFALGAVMVIADGDTRYRAACGHADRARTRPMTVGDRFRIGGVTETFTAALALQLVDDDAVALDDTVASFGLDVDGAATITVRDLLAHTAGLVDYHADPGFDWSQPWTIASVIAWVTAERDLLFAPGTAWSYAGTGFEVASEIVGAEGRPPYPTALRTRLLEPLGLADTFLEGAEPIAGGRVEGSHLTGATPVAPSGTDDWASASGSMVSTGDDLATWAQRLLGGDDVLAPATRSQMTTPIVLPDRTQPLYLDSHVGLGLSIEDDEPDGPIYWHGGVDFGFVAYVGIQPATGRVVAVVLNSENLDPIEFGEMGWAILER
jgi:D-alanyl-D-alanine carboxypeptidase